jgi:hypothetical protein
MLAQTEESLRFDEHFQGLCSKVEKAVTLKAIILSSFLLARYLAVKIVEKTLAGRAQLMDERPICPKCGTPLDSKGFLSRKIKTIIGLIQWKRRAWRCPRGCKIGQVAPLDDELALKPNQRTSDELKQAACVLAVFVPFAIAASLLKTLTGVEVSAESIWNWVQYAGKKAMAKLESELQALKEGQAPDAEEIESKLALLPLLIGGDGAMVPFRPNGGSPEGKTVWQEVKVGIVARLGQRITKTGKKVSVLVRRRLVAVLGTIDDFKPRIWLASVKEGILEARIVVWLSDGGRGFWTLFYAQFSRYAQGILDFYHAAQNIWKGARSLFDGRTKKARQWFAWARRRLRLGKAKEVLAEIKGSLTSNTPPDSVQKTLENLVGYLEGHIDHISYDRYKELGLPIGSGMVESVCKWLIQQRFKCVGMRWSEDGFNHLLHLRLAWVNGTYDDLFDSIASPKS